ncbi:MAG: tetratricopeptide repeat protein [Balneolaceae bacterium]|nr:tetratricopeptide repeat protein [Balneolaceae bacterium]
MIHPKAVQKNEKYINLKSLFFFFMMIGLSAVSFSSTFAQTTVLINDAFFEIDAKKAIDSLYNRNTDAADEILGPWREKHPGHPIWLLWDGMEVWWNVLEDLDNQSLDREFIARMQQADYEAGKILRSEPGHPDALIIRAVANGYIARLHANREDWLTSVQVGRKAYQAHQELIKVAPNLPDNHFAEGMKLYYAAYIPEEYPVVKAVSWFFPEGDRKEGLTELRFAAKNGVFARPESKYFLANILHHYENSYDEAREIFADLIATYPDNSYYRREYLQTLSQLNQYDEILAFSNETLEYWQSKDKGIDPVLETEIQFWKGRAYYYNGNFENAKPHLVESVDIGKELVNSKQREIYILAAYFAGRTNDRLGQKEEAKKYYEIAADQRTIPEARKRSREELQNL